MSVDQEAQHRVDALRVGAMLSTMANHFGYGLVDVAWEGIREELSAEILATFVIERMDYGLDMEENKCPVEGCTGKRYQGHLMCRKHWYEVPQPLRTEVWRTWRDFTDYRAREKSGKNKYSSITEAMNAYRSARDEAIVVVSS